MIKQLLLVSMILPVMAQDVSKDAAAPKEVTRTHMAAVINAEATMLQFYSQEENLKTQKETASVALQNAIKALQGDCPNGFNIEDYSCKNVSEGKSK